MDTSPGSTRSATTAPSIGGAVVAEPHHSSDPVATAAPVSLPRRMRALPAWPRPWRQLSFHHALLGLILSAAAALRCFGINWDDGSGLHPDERHIVGIVNGLGLPTSLSVLLSPADPVFLGKATGPISPLNPHDFTFGSLPLYLYWMAAHLAVWLSGWVPGLSWWNAATGGGLLLVGRAVSVIAGTLTVLVVYLIGRRLYGRAGGLLAAGLFACCVLAVQTAHFLTVDTLATLFATTALYCCARLVADGRSSRALAAGAATGAALACTAGMLPLALPLLIAPLLSRGRPPLSSTEAFDARAWLRRCGLLILAIAALLVVFFATQPYALLDWPKYISDVQAQVRLIQGADHAPATDAFYRTTPYWYHLEHIVPWDLGWPLGVAALGGLASASWRSVGFRRSPRHRTELLLVVWTLVYFALAGAQFAKYVRFMLPLMPALCLFAAGLLAAAPALAARYARRLRRDPRARRRTWRVVARWHPALALGLLALTALYAVAYDTIYITLDTRLQASRWIAAHVKPGEPFATQGAYDDALPIFAPVVPLQGSYNGVNVATAAGGDTALAWTTGLLPTPPLAATVARAHYVTISSARLLSTVAHLPEAFPYSSRYYQLLFDGRLGFRLVAAYNNHPHLFGLTLDDYTADQDFNAYDHPPVWIFARDRPMTVAATAALITDGGRVHDVATMATPAKSLLLTPRERALDAAGPTYAEEFQAHSTPMRWPLPVWLFWIEALGLLALPLTLRLFRRLPDRGVVLSKVVGLLLAAYLTWIAASLHLLPFTHATILAASTLVGLASLAWGVPLREAGAWLHARVRLVVAAEAVFLVGFAADTVARMLYPDLWNSVNGGEKPMDFSYLNSLVRSQTMPPADPWFSGGYLNYYYYGYYLVATLIKLTGIAPSLAYNLAVPTLFGLTLAGAYTIVYALTRRTGLGVLASGLTALAGNLYILVQAGAVLIALSPWRLAAPLVGGVVELAGGLWQLTTQQAILGHQVFPPISFRGVNGWGWDSTRVLDGGYTINEFPAFSFLYADLHAHMIDLPIMLTCVALAVNAALGARPWLGGGRAELGRSIVPGAGPACLVLIAIVIGTAGPTNTWDIVTALTVVALGLAVSVYTSGRSLGLALATALAFGGALDALGLALYAPFYGRLASLYSSVGFTLAHTDLAHWLMMWGLFLFILTSYAAVELWRGSIGAWARRLGRVLRLMLAHWPRRERVRALLRLSPSWGVQRDPRPAPPQGLLVIGAGFVLGAVALLAAAPVLALLLVLMGVTLALLLERPPRADASSIGRRAVILLLGLVALGIAAVCEVAYLADFQALSPWYRMNTVFKLYEQAWLLFAVSSAGALAALVRPPRLSGLLLRPQHHQALGIVALPLRRVRARESTRARAERLRPTVVGRRLWLVSLAVLLGGVALYPLLEVPAHLAERASSGYWAALGNPPLGPTLDGTAFARVAFPGEYEALSWLNAHAHGDPTVLASDEGFYDNFAFRVPWMTGLPNVVQGKWEASQQRYNGQTDTKQWPYAPYPTEINDRDADVQQAFTTTVPAVALGILHKYRVGYVYVGLAERGQTIDHTIGGSPSGCVTPGGRAALQPPPDCAGYTAAQLAKFDRMAALGMLRVVYRRAGVTIYEVVS